MRNIFKKYSLVMRPIIFLGLVSGFIPLILIPALLVYENRDDYIDGLMECFNYAWKGAND